MEVWLRADALHDKIIRQPRVVLGVALNMALDLSHL